MGESMGWEDRNGRSYYYRKMRVGKHVVSRYFGSGVDAALAADLDDLERARRLRETAELQQLLQAEKAIDKQLGELARALDILVGRQLTVGGFHRHRGQWRRTAMRTQSKLTRIASAQPTAKDPIGECVDLYHAMEKEKNPSMEQLNRFRDLAMSTPELRTFASQLSHTTRRQLIMMIANGGQRAMLWAEADILLKQFGYESAPPLEQLLIDQIVTSRIRVIHAEREYNAQICAGKSFSHASGYYWEHFLTVAHKRHQHAIETLVRVRRLCRGGPLLQVNIAREGGQQLNLQGIL